jgi:aspartyl-tRNA(Asn)/glutamyl-tRNA(Gln) amidotransferase subunit C
VDSAEVQKLAQLAQIDLTEAEAGEIAGQLGEVLAHFRSLAGVEIEGVEPLTGPTDVLRRDAPQGGLATEEALREAPESREGYFHVPRVLEEGR